LLISLLSLFGRQKQSGVDRQAEADRLSRDALRDSLQELNDTARSISKELLRASNEHDPQTRSKRNWERSGTLAVWAAAFVGACAIFQSSRDSESQRKLTFEEQRPWIYAVFSPSDRIFWNQSGGLTIPVTFVLRNTGKIPAQFVEVVAEAHTSPHFYKSGGFDIAAEQSRACKSAMDHFDPSHNSEASVFPGMILPIGINPGIPKEEWTDYSQNGFGPGLFIYGCIVYQVSKGEPLGTTGFAFTIDRIDQSRPGVFALPSDPTLVPQNELSIHLWPDGSLWQAR